MRRAYRNIGYYFLAILGIVLIGYYVNHLVGASGSPTLPGFTWLHLVALLLWFALMFIQPFLIKQKRPELHRIIGKASYFIVPLLVISAHEMQRIGYNAHLAQIPEDERLGVLFNTYLDLFFFIGFYMLAMFFRPDISKHICFMVGTSLILLSPGLNRLLFAIFRDTVVSEIITFSLQQVVIILFVVFERRNVKKNVWKSPWILLFGLMLVKTALFYIIPGTNAWQWVAGQMVKWIY